MQKLDKMSKSTDQPIDFWTEKWDRNDIGFHQHQVHKMLQKHFSLMSSGSEDQKVFVPLCGKTLDMKWMSDQGLKVVGVEAARKALEDFKTEHSLEWVEQDVAGMGPDGKLFKDKDDKFRFYMGNILQFNKEFEGQFDCVWDRGSLVALNRGDVKRYSEVLKEILKPGGKILVEVFEYDKAIFDGRPPPPHPVSEEEVRSLYEPDCLVEPIDRTSRLLQEKEVSMVYYMIVKK